MSYNTDLQNNNTSLQEILATVNSLPEAGGSSGGGAEIETVEINLYCTFSFTVYYINENLEPTQISLGVDEDIYIQVLKNSILVAIVPMGVTPLGHGGNIEALYKENSTAIYRIYGNGFISL